MSKSYNCRKFLGDLTFGLGLTALGTSGVSSDSSTAFSQFP
ncbi:hypothetical protein [Desertivirga brevis]|nr:hypothetical protein [Pedobacter sp. SYSU D00873]